VPTLYITVRRTSENGVYTYHVAEAYPPGQVDKVVLWRAPRGYFGEITLRKGAPSIPFDAYPSGETQSDTSVLSGLKPQKSGTFTGIICRHRTTSWGRDQERFNDLPLSLNCRAPQGSGVQCVLYIGARVQCPTRSCCYSPSSG